MRNSLSAASSALRGAMQEWSEGHKSVLQILAERESIFRLLPQTTSENLSKEFKNYAPSPTTR